MQVTETILDRCRVEIEGPLKRRIRSIIIPWVKWRHRLAEVGEGFQFGSNIGVPAGSRIGRYAYVGSGFEARNPVVIGDLCMLSTHIRIFDNDHGIDEIGNPTRLAFRSSQNVTVLEADVWIGKGAILRSGIRIGRGAVIGAGSVVTKNVMPYCIVAGIPAATIRQRFTIEEQMRHDLALYGASADGSLA